MNTNTKPGAAFILVDWLLHRLVNEQRLTTEEAEAFRREISHAFGLDAPFTHKELKEARETTAEHQEDPVLPPLSPAEVERTKHKGVLTKENKMMIASLRRRGYGYKRIANELCLNTNTIKSFCRRHPLEPLALTEEYKTDDGTTRFCKNCGAVVKQLPGRKEKKFCSDTCRNKWWGKHQEQVNRKSMYSYECPTCGKPFMAYGNRNRKYCSHECYITARFGEQNK